MVEIDLIQEEKKKLEKQQQELDIRLHQLVGAVYEVQSILQEISLENRPSDSLDQPLAVSHQTRPSEGVDLNIHQEQPLETEKNSQQPS